MIQKRWAIVTRDGTVRSTYWTRWAAARQLHVQNEAAILFWRWTEKPRGEIAWQILKRELTSRIERI